ncbi:MAG: AmmeMemoRadiSam system protein B [Aquificae bacterium]|nr:AmmeMemoRadiSam system protein B [Aquificota bacterium]
MITEVRQPAVSDLFYPADPIELKAMLKKFLDEAPLYPYKPEIVVSPHAGYIYSGSVAGVSYKQLLNLDLNQHYTVLLIGPSHHVPFEGISFGYYKYWLTPLGEVKVDTQKIEEFVLTHRDMPITLNTIPHAKEHSLEVQVPFLQMVLPDFSIVPVVYGQVDYETVKEVIRWFKDNYPNVIVVISTDLSHYYPDNIARQIDKYCNLAVENLDIGLLERCEACGKIGLGASILYAKERGLKGKVLDYKTSGDTSGDYSAVVGYASYIFYRE